MTPALAAALTFALTAQAGSSPGAVPVGDLPALKRERRPLTTTPLPAAAFPAASGDVQVYSDVKSTTGSVAFAYVFGADKAPARVLVVDLEKRVVVAEYSERLHFDHPTGVTILSDGARLRAIHSLTGADVTPRFSDGQPVTGIAVDGERLVFFGTTPARTVWGAYVRDKPAVAVLGSVPVPVHAFAQIFEGSVASATVPVQWCDLATGACAPTMPRAKAPAAGPPAPPILDVTPPPVFDGSPTAASLGFVEDGSARGFRAEELRPIPYHQGRLPFTFLAVDAAREKDLWFVDVTRGTRTWLGATGCRGALVSSVRVGDRFLVTCRPSRNPFDPGATHSEVIDVAGGRRVRVDLVEPWLSPNGRFVYGTNPAQRRELLVIDLVGKPLP